MASRIKKAKEEQHLSSFLGEKSGMNGMNKMKTLKYITSTRLYNYTQLILENEKNNTLYIIDMRTVEEHKTEHIKKAIHKNNKKKLKEIELDIQINKTPIIVFYGAEVNDESKKEKTSNRMETSGNKYVENIMENCFIVIKNYFRKSKGQFYVLKEGFMNFEKKYPFLCLSTGDEESEETDTVTPQVIASINYPLEIFENIYLGNFIHMNNPLIYHYLNIKHVYDFTASGFSKQMHQKVHYHRYDVFKKKFRKKNFSETEPITYTNFLSINFMHDVICHIAKHDKKCLKRVRVGNNKGYQSKDANVETKTEAHEDHTREEKKQKNEQTYGHENEQKKRGSNVETDSSLEARISTEPQKGAEKENRNKEETQEQKQESAQEQEQKQETAKKQKEMKKETDRDQEDEKTKRKLEAKHKHYEQKYGKEKEWEIEEDKKKENEKQNRNDEHKEEQNILKKKKEQEQEQEQKQEQEQEQKQEQEQEQEQKQEQEQEQEQKQEQEQEQKQEQEQEQEQDQETESENEENTKEQKKAKSILILCNEGIKNQEKTKINSISLIICMCYIMFRNKCNETFAVACFLKIYNELQINAHTYTFLKIFYQYLESNNFCLEHKKKGNKERKDAEKYIGNIGKDEEEYIGYTELDENRNRKTSQKNQRETEQRKSEFTSNDENRTDSEDSNCYARNESNREFEGSINMEKINFGEIRRKIWREYKNSDSDTVTEEQYNEIMNTGLKSKNFTERKKRRFEKALLEIGENDVCKRVFSSFKIKEQCVIFEENKNNVIYMKYKAPRNTDENREQYDASTIMSKILLLHHISKNINCDYEHMLASILYNIYTEKMTSISEIDLCSSALLNAVRFEKHDIFVTMPYISLITFNIFVVTKKEVDMDSIMKKCQIPMDIHIFLSWILCMIEKYIVCSILYILKNVQKTTKTNEFKITFHLTKEELRTIPVSKEIYLVLAALKYFLITLLHFYVQTSIKNLYVDFIMKINRRVLKRISEFSDFYYSVYNININKFLKEDYLPQVDPYDNLPYYFSDILRPFIILDNYLNE